MGLVFINQLKRSPISGECDAAAAASALSLGEDCSGNSNSVGWVVGWVVGAIGEVCARLTDLEWNGPEW